MKKLINWLKEIFFPPSETEIFERNIKDLFLKGESINSLVFSQIQKTDGRLLELGCSFCGPVLNIAGTPSHLRGVCVSLCIKNLIVIRDNIAMTIPWTVGIYSRLEHLLIGLRLLEKMIGNRQQYTDHDCLKQCIAMQKYTEWMVKEFKQAE